MSISNIEDIKKRNMGHEKIKKSSKFIDESLIEYTDNNFIDEMRKGYKEMGKINLEICKLGYEYMLDDVDEYEAWICGV